MKRTLTLAACATVVFCLLFLCVGRAQKRPESSFVASAAFPSAAQKPSADCTTQITPLTLELRQGIPLPRTFHNPTSSAVTFIITMQANALFGPAHEVSRIPVAARSGMTMSEADVYPTGLRTPLGSARVIFNVTTDKTGGDVVGRCDYQLTLKAPPGVVGKVPRPVVVSRFSLNYLYQVPVRMCVLEGSALAGDKKAGDVIGGGQILDLLESVNRDIWFPQAQIAFSSAIDSGIPVVADPTPPRPGCGVLGDLEVAGLANGDAPFAETNCATAWEQRYPGRVGIPVIFAHDFCNSLSIKGGSPDILPGLYVKSRKASSGQRGDDLCGVPRHLTSADVTNQTRRPFVVVIDPSRDTSVHNHLAHELGHNLFLGHGNGFDDNHDGMPAGRRGPRRYDEYCDPGWLLPPDNIILAEDDGIPFVDCEHSGSLMQPSAGCSNLQPLQVETARDVARLMPGFVDGTPQPVLTAFSTFPYTDCLLVGVTPIPCWVGASR